ncbi:GNAT family N-acetyltransferase [Chryseobacterium sp. W4I1]|uniref:GNAT family N-acetyltransferase n=1 Tax=Chryseobacterium sp. W4I1 TaxID=3042293 RepID=UPI002785A49C|nr:GNAT family N-acetyltransferase [Chryseobacterium sp. W4I1]MDQ0780311.1 RimJ/RimL family protein N-acetyltransferase [Chryseobacterium sp. W4I1]
MISLAFFKKEDFFGVNYTLDEEQKQYTSTAEKALQRIKDKNDSKAFAVTVFEDKKPAGFFVLDFGDDKFELTDNKNSVLLRSLSVNPELQGKGIGKAAMQKADDFVKLNFPQCDEIVLAVNHKNHSAYHVYLKTGYIKHEKTIIGRSGPQYVMSKKF